MNVVIIIDKKEAKQRKQHRRTAILTCTCATVHRNTTFVTLIQVYLISRSLFSKHNDN